MYVCMNACRQVEHLRMHGKAMAAVKRPLPDTRVRHPACRGAAPPTRASGTLPARHHGKQCAQQTKRPQRCFRHARLHPGGRACGTQACRTGGVLDAAWGDWSVGVRGRAGSGTEVAEAGQDVLGVHVGCDAKVCHHALHRLEDVLLRVRQEDVFLPRCCRCCRRCRCCRCGNAPRCRVSVAAGV